MRESIMNPQAKMVTGFGPIMPTFQGQVSEEQLLQILAFIKSLQSEAPQPAGRPAQPSGCADIAGASVSGKSPAPTDSKQ